MNQKTIILTFVLFALIVLGMFVFAKLRSLEGSEIISFLITKAVTS